MGSTYPATRRKRSFAGSRTFGRRYLSIQASIQTVDESVMVPLT
jgi:hypothetical protein